MKKKIIISLSVLALLLLLSQIKITLKVSGTSSISMNESQVEFPINKTYTSKISKIISLRKKEQLEAENKKQRVQEIFSGAEVKYEITDIKFLKFGESK
ncbi:MAG TPA: hypothetical protein VMX17_06540 [Candidatus Glassbacteria bacterium]|nr:hypothetical protein [Candidatus Glassbacteria bacterium]